MGRGGEDKRLREPDQDLTHHGQGERGRGAARATIAKPVADKYKAGRDNDRTSGAPGVEDIECDGRDNHEGEEKCCAEPIYSAGCCGEVGRGGICDCGER